jgi:hypothetical protein
MGVFKVVLKNIRSKYNYLILYYGCGLGRHFRVLMSCSACAAASLRRQFTLLRCANPAGAGAVQSKLSPRHTAPKVPFGVARTLEEVLAIEP